MSFFLRLSSLISILFSLPANEVSAQTTNPVVTVEVSGQLPKSTDENQFELSILAKSVPNEDVLTGDLCSVFSQRILVKIDGRNGNLPLKKAYSGVEELYLQCQSGTAGTDSSTGKPTINFVVNVVEGTAGSMEPIIESGTAKVTVSYVDDATKETPTVYGSSSATDIKKNTAVPNVAPEGVTIQAGHSTLTVSWAQKDKINYTGGATATPGRVTAFLLERPNAQVNLDAVLYGGEDKDEDKPQGCHIDAAFEDGGKCVVCDDETNYYLSKTQPSVEVATSLNATTSIPFSGLENGKEYVVFLQYEPSGLRRSTCHLASPRENTTMLELNGEPAAEETDVRCFVATAAYGSPLDAHVSLLRWFRGKYLMKSMLGRTFVRYYYRYSPEAARYIADRPTLRAVVRGALFVPVSLAFALKWSGENPSTALALTVLTGTFVLAWLARPKRRVEAA